jgi:1-acyl-sn-glycerol-3-phosphate acyltransferase
MMFGEMDISARHHQNQRCGQLGQWLDWMLLSSIFPSSSKLTFQQMMNGSVAQHPCFVSSMRKLGPFPLPKTDCW